MSCIREIRSAVDTFRLAVKPNLESVSAASRKVRDASAEVERSWSGSFAGWHATMYYRKYEVPSIHELFNGEWGGLQTIPEGWAERQPKEVVARIDDLAGGPGTLDHLEEDIQSLQKTAEHFKMDVEVILSSDVDVLRPKEIELVKEIEQFVFGGRRSDYIRKRLPHQLWSRDSEAVRQGAGVPSWLQCDAAGFVGATLCSSINQFVELVDGLARRLERVPTQGANTVADLASLHPDISAKCKALYEQRAYAEAVEKSFKVVRDRLRKLTGYETGSEAFGRGKLYVNGAAAPNVEQDFNEGVKFLMMAIDRFRNVKSHTSNAKIDDPVRAYEYLCVSSLAMKLLDNAEVRP